MTTWLYIHSKQVADDCLKKLQVVNERREKEKKKQKDRQGNIVILEEIIYLFTKKNTKQQIKKPNQNRKTNKIL